MKGKLYSVKITYVVLCKNYLDTWYYESEAKGSATYLPGEGEF